MASSMGEARGLRMETNFEASDVFWSYVIAIITLTLAIGLWAWTSRTDGTMWRLKRDTRRELDKKNPETTQSAAVAFSRPSEERCGW